MIKHRPFSEDKANCFGIDLASIDWAPLHLMEASEAADFLESALSELYHRHFPEVSFIIKSSDPPWMNRQVKRLARKKKERYKMRRKDETWKKIATETVAAVAEAKKSYVDKACNAILETNSSKCLFKAVNCLKSKDRPPAWSVENLFPGKPAGDIANECVEFFSAISKEFNPLPEPDVSVESGWKVELHEVAAKLRHCKKPKSMVRGDLPGRLVTKFADLLAIPLQCIYNKVLKDFQWPILWKQETVKIIPKKSIPESLKDVRNISCTPLFSKVLEHFVLSKLRETIKLSKCQFGGLKGVSIDHFLCEAWHDILMALDGEQSAASLMSIDFSKAFNRMDHNVCLNALRGEGVPEEVVQVVHAFLFNRVMTVHVNGVQSTPQLAPGGAPQGSVLGSVLFCVVTETLNRIAIRQDATASFQENGLDMSATSARSTSLSPIRAPYRASTPIDAEELESSDDGSDESELLPGIRTTRQRLLDSTILSFLPSQSLLDRELGEGQDRRENPSVKAYIDDYNVIEKVSTRNAACHYTEGKSTYKVHAPQLQRIFIDVKTEASDLGMVVNDDKTQLLCINNLGKQVRSFINVPDGRIISADKLKILGFYFGECPDLSVNTARIIGKFNSKLWGMRHLKMAGMTRSKLLFIYKATVRPTVEFASNTFHCMLSKQQAAELERLQLRAMKIIFGDTVAYNTVLQSGLISSLESRRESNFRKFAEKTEKNTRFSHWFTPNREIPHNTRRREKYYIPRLRTERGSRSPIIQIRKYLNSI